MKQACRAATRGRPLMSKKGTLPSVTKAGSAIKCMNLKAQNMTLCTQSNTENTVQFSLHQKTRQKAGLLSYSSVRGPLPRSY